MLPNAPPYILLDMAMEGYWSGMRMLNAAPLPTVATASELKLLNRDVMGSTRDWIKPVCCMMPTYAMTKMTMEMVGSISTMPPVESSSSSIEKPVADTTPEFAASMATPG